MKIKIITVGKIKEKSTQDWINEFLKRIKRYAKIEITEIKEAGKEKETQKVQELLKKEDYNILLAINSKQQTSEKFAQMIKEKLLTQRITFVIGGAEGIGQLKKINQTLSISEMTFTHQIARLLLLEQIYRALTIIKGTKYHK